VIVIASLSRSLLYVSPGEEYPEDAAIEAKDILTQAEEANAMDPVG
jgi:hypothetical protein